MKKILQNAFFLLSIACLAMQNTSAQNYCVSNANGEMQSNIWTCYGNAVRPTISSFTGDSLVIKHTVSWGTTQNEVINLSGSNLKLLVVKSGAKIGPNVNNNELLLPTNAVVRIDAGGSISPLSGNNSNHAVNIGGVCIWGKKCCGGNQTIFGLNYMTSAFPCGFTPLPVDLISFTGKQVSDARVFNWITATESNVSHFTLEESTDGVNWNTVGYIKANGNTNAPTEYHYSLTQYAQGTAATYRLSETNFAGEVSILKTITVIAKTTDAATVTRTPTGVSIVAGSEVEKVNVKITDLYGKLVYSQSDIANNGNINVQVSGFTAGMYMVSVINAADQSVLSTEKIILQ